MTGGEISRVYHKTVRVVTTTMGAKHGGEMYRSWITMPSRLATASLNIS